MAFLEGMLDLLGMISRNPFSFFFAVVMNFFLLYGVFCLNMCSLYLVEIAKALEQRRTGGRDTNEVELRHKPSSVAKPVKYESVINDDEAPTIRLEVK